eukprot:scaffold19935_cov108-Isochrysis_galbana.AAC.4
MALIRRGASAELAFVFSRLSRPLPPPPLFLLPHACTRAVLVQGVDGRDHCSLLAIHESRIQFHRAWAARMPGCNMRKFFFYSMRFAAVERALSKSASVAVAARVSALCALSCSHLPAVISAALESPLSSLPLSPLSVTACCHRRSLSLSPHLLSTWTLSRLSPLAGRRSRRRSGRRLAHRCAVSPRH